MRIPKDRRCVSTTAAPHPLIRRAEAMYVLEHQRFMMDPEDPDSPPSFHPAFSLALAKLLFKDDRGNEALLEAGKVIGSLSEEGNDDARKRAADAYYLCGWIAIHMDDHTAAYKYWADGHMRLKDDVPLARQEGKRALWDGPGGSGGEGCNGMFGAAALAGGGFERERDFDAFKVHPNMRSKCPALALFDEIEQRDELVFRTREPIMTAEECASVLKAVEEYIEVERGGVWGTVRKASVPTTDVAVEDVPRLRPWLKALMRRCLWPMLHEAFPKLADGTTTVDEATGKSRMRLHDAFIVRYDAKDGSFSLPEHSDTSSMSFTISLNDGGGDEFDGGGTWFEALDENGGVVVDGGLGCATAFAGPLRHAGYPISRGTRIILVLFCYVEHFAYGRFIKDFCAKVSSEEEIKDDEGERAASSAAGEEELIKSSGDKPGGYVVYRQTVELASMLAKSDVV